MIGIRLKFKKYNRKYSRSCAELIKTTWDLEEGFKNPKKVDSIYQYFLKSCINYSEHLDIIVDENDNVKGLLFGSIEDETYPQMVKYMIRTLEINLWAFFNLIIGNFGDREVALNMKNDNNSIDKLGEAYAKEFDSEINLFIVSPELRGEGYGIKLMNRYIEFCKENELHRIFLWTELSCSYSFYEKYGFKLYKKFYHESLTEGDKDKLNGLIYYYTI
ncbi:GNAT family N-acetyltransferase [Clostridium sediminicola]|uniref:GNAT family N-acetyltransferase n=1 Tax=Clostridium sediminicola TaxID=3114879 RepID=UPI003D175D30